ncbi:MAG: polymerase sigma factor [Verrucomicrobia bacterium]|nr:polymerase sigma factor [Verrucomicrobiota bacterium]
MPLRAATPAIAAHSGAAFAPTQWSMILEARGDSARQRKAFEQLCTAYWLPIYGYLRRRQHSPADAEDLTQGFFVYLMEGDFLERPDPAKGRFRGFLVGALKHFLGAHFERASAQKRGGDIQFIDWTGLDAEHEFAAVDQQQADPSDVYERSWALTLLGRALTRLAEEQTSAGKGRQFEQLKPFLSSTPTRGDYEAAATALATTRTNVAVWVHRLNARYAELVKLEVSATVRDPAEIEQELRHVLQALGR